MQSDEPDAHEKTRPNAGDSVLQVDQSGTGDASSPDAALSASIPATAKSFAAGFAPTQGSLYVGTALVCHV